MPCPETGDIARIVLETRSKQAAKRAISITLPFSHLHHIHPAAESQSGKTPNLLEYFPLIPTACPVGRCEFSQTLAILA
jgi:hypothetical protein